MRICLYTESALPTRGVQELAVDSLARQFQACGHDVVVLTLSAPRGARVDDGALGYPVVRHRRFLSKRFLLGWHCRHIEAVYRAYPFNVLHCHNVYPAGHVAMQWSAERGIPVVLTSYGSDIAPQNPLLRKPRVPLRIAHVLHQAAAVVAINKSLQHRCHVLGADPARTVRIPIGVDYRRHATAAPRPGWLHALIQPRRYFLFLGPLTHHAGADLLWAAYRALAESCPAHLVVIGQGGESPPSFMPDLRVHPREDRVHLLGAVAGPERIYLLQNALCTVIPARVAAGAPLLVLESYAAGVPVVATQIPVLEESVRPRVTGLGVPTESPAALAEALAFMAADRARAHAWGLAAQRLARKFDWRLVARRHLELYASLSGDRVQRRVAA